MRHVSIASATILVFAVSTGSANSAEPNASAGQQRLAALASENKYAFVMFYRDNGPATQTMADVVKRGTDARSGQAAAMYVNIADGTEKALVDQFGVSRTPMPLTIAVAPNGAITGMFSKNMSDQRLGGAFVSPGIASSMKAMQAGKVVFVCVTNDRATTIPACVTEFQSDPQFQGRAAVILLASNDAAEATFLSQLELNGDKAGAATVAFLAPPGVLVGKFNETSTKDELAAALHKAGKCCEDPHCKHNKSR